MNEQWKNKKVAFLGDSITDKIHVGTTRNYWDYLADSSLIVPLVYELNGWTWAGIREQAENLLKDHGDDVDALFVFMGTNDYRRSVPLGEWFELREEEVNSDGVIRKKMRRCFNTDPETFRGRINNGMSFLKKHFPKQQIILLTPIHRGFACFSETNVQPEEAFPNELNLYVESYIGCIKEAGNIWSVPVIDLNSVSGLFPMMDEYAQYYHDPADGSAAPQCHRSPQNCGGAEISDADVSGHFPVNGGTAYAETAKDDWFCKFLRDYFSFRSCHACARIFSEQRVSGRISGA